MRINSIHQAQNLLNNVEVQCGKISLKINAKKTKSVVFNHQLPVTLHTLDGSKLEIVQDFKYLGSLTQNTEADIKSRKAAAWKSLQQTQEHLESTTRKILQIETFLGSSGICTTVRFRGLDTHQNPGKTTWWLLYMPPAHCLKCQLGTAHDQWRAIWFTPKALNKAGKEEIAVCRSLF